jgi:hypothetical protein
MTFLKALSAPFSVSSASALRAASTKRLYCAGSSGLRSGLLGMDHPLNAKSSASGASEGAFISTWPLNRFSIIRANISWLCASLSALSVPTRRSATARSRCMSGVIRQRRGSATVAKFLSAHLTALKAAQHRKSVQQLRLLARPKANINGRVAATPGKPLCSRTIPPKYYLATSGGLAIPSMQKMFRHMLQLDKSILPQFDVLCSIEGDLA